jgi:hypothetical protein
MTAGVTEDITRWGGGSRGDFRRQVKLGDKWTYGDWGLLLAKEPDIAPAEVKYKSVDVPAADGSLDLTEALTPEPVYQHRTLSLGLVFKGPEREWTWLRAEVENYCSGRRMQVRFSEDDTHYFMGRVQVKSFTKSGPVAVLQLEVDADPWRYKTSATRAEIDVPSGESYTLALHNERKRAVPTLTVGTEVRVDKLDKEGLVVWSRDFTAGAYLVLGLSLSQGETRLQITSTGADPAHFTIQYQEASL